jgi:hypothetical protein
MENVPGTVIVIWWIALILAALVVLPLAVHLLHRTLKAAMQIEHYLARAREATEGIARNTAEASQLNTTLEVAPQLLESSASIEHGSGELLRTLASRLERGRR